MVVEIKSGASKKEIEAALAKSAKLKNKRQGFDSYRFCGVIKLDEEPLATQRRLRDEWK